MSDSEDATALQQQQITDIPELSMNAPIEQVVDPQTALLLAERSLQLSCRMYSNRFPEVDECVMVNVKHIAEMGAYVHLLEYNNIEVDRIGMILLSELSRRRIRSIQKLIRVGRNEVVVVMRVDKEKGYIDLSKRRVSPEDLLKCEEKFLKSKTVHAIMRHCSDKLNLSLESVCEQIAWPLYASHGHAYDAFKESINDFEAVFKNLTIEPELRKMVEATIRKRMTPQAVKVRSDLEVTCFGYEGIDAIKAALKAGEECSTPDIPIKIKLVAPPLYVMTTNTLDKVLAVEVLERAILRIEEVIKQNQGVINIKMRPKAVSDQDEMELAKLMEQAEKENKEVSGDEEDEDEEEDHKNDKEGDDEESEEEE